MIPRTIHQVWLGSLPPPKRWMETWKGAHPGWEYRLWDERAVEEFGLTNRALYNRLMRIGRYDGASDVIRAEVLYRFGGVYIDADSVCLRSLEGAPFMEADLFVVEERAPQHGYLLNGCFMGSVPQHPTMAAYIQALGQVKVLKPTWRTVGPVLVTKVFQEHGGATVLDPAVFFTRTLGGEPVEGVHYGEHYWSSTTERSLKLGKLGGSPWPAGDVEGLSVLVAFRDDPPTVRTRAWDFIRGHLERQLPEAQICVGTDDSVPFNKCVAVNRAAAQATGDVYMLTDSDTWVDPAKVQEAVAYVRANPLAWCKPWITKTRLDESTSNLVMERGDIWRGELPHRPGFERRHPFWASPPVVMHRDVWHAIGGMDERFAGGWGREDSGLAMALKVLYGPSKTLSGECIHLWHPRNGTAGNDQWDGQVPGVNDALWQRYRRAAARPELMRELIGERT